MRTTKPKKKTKRSVTVESPAAELPPAPFLVQRAVRMCETIRLEILHQKVAGLGGHWQDERLLAQYVLAATHLYVRERRPSTREQWTTKIQALVDAQEHAKETTP